MKEYKVVVMGGGGVGKSALTVQYVQSEFVERYDPTIEDSYRKVIERLGKDAVALEILDTAGTEQFTAMRDMYIKSGDGFLFVYSITSPATLHDLQALKERMNKVKPSAKIVLVGNKRDLVSERLVSRSQGEGLAAKWKCKFMETSAKNRPSVEEAFNMLIEEIDSQEAEKKQNENNDHSGYSFSRRSTDYRRIESTSGDKKKKCIIS